MKKLFTTRYNANAYNSGLLIIRVAFGILLMSHGYGKLVGFSEMKDGFMNFMGLGSTLSLALIVFAEFFCGLFVALGLFTRLSCIPIIIGMGVAFFIAHNGEGFGKGEMALFYMSVATGLLFTGPGKFSIDGGIWK